MNLDSSALVWFLIGGICTAAMMIAIALCMVAGKCSRIEEYRDDKLKVKNWVLSRERLAMTERNRDE